MGAMKYLWPQQQFSKFVWTPWEIPKALSGESMRSNDLFRNIKMSFAFFILFLTLRTFQELQNVWYHNRLNGRSRGKNQLTSIKPELRDVHKCKMSSTTLLKGFCLFFFLTFWPHHDGIWNLSFPTADRTFSLCSGSAEFYLLDHQGCPQAFVF